MSRKHGSDNIALSCFLEVQPFPDARLPVFQAASSDHVGSSIVHRGGQDRFLRVSTQCFYRREAMADKTAMMPPPQGKGARRASDTASTTSKPQVKKKGLKRGASEAMKSCGRCGTFDNVMSFDEAPVAPLDDDTQPSSGKGKGSKRSRTQHANKTTTSKTITVNGCRGCYSVYDMGAYRQLGWTFSAWCQKCSTDGEFDGKISKQRKVVDLISPRTWDDGEVGNSETVRVIATSKMGFVRADNFSKVFDTPLSLNDSNAQRVKWPNGFGKLREGTIVRLEDEEIELIDVQCIKEFSKKEFAQTVGKSCSNEQTAQVAEKAKRAWKSTELPTALRGHKEVPTVGDVAAECAAACRTHGIPACTPGLLADGGGLRADGDEEAEEEEEPEVEAVDEEENGGDALVDGDRHDSSVPLTRGALNMHNQASSSDHPRSEKTLTRTRGEDGSICSTAAKRQTARGKGSGSVVAQSPAKSRHSAESMDGTTMTGRSGKAGTDLEEMERLMCLEMELQPSAFLDEELVGDREYALRRLKVTDPACVNRKETLTILIMQCKAASFSKLLAMPNKAERRQLFSHFGVPTFEWPVKHGSKLVELDVRDATEVLKCAGAMMPIVTATVKFNPMNAKLSALVYDTPSTIWAKFEKLFVSAFLSERLAGDGVHYPFVAQVTDVLYDQLVDSKYDDEDLEEDVEEFKNSATLATASILLMLDPNQTRMEDTVVQTKRYHCLLEQAVRGTAFPNHTDVVTEPSKSPA